MPCALPGSLGGGLELVERPAEETSDAPRVVTDGVGATAREAGAGGPDATESNVKEAVTAKPDAASTLPRGPVDFGAASGPPGGRTPLYALPGKPHSGGVDRYDAPWIESGGRGGERTPDHAVAAEAKSDNFNRLVGAAIAVLLLIGSAALFGSRENSVEPRSGIERSVVDRSTVAARRGAAPGSTTRPAPVGARSERPARAVPARTVVEQTRDRTSEGSASEAMEAASPRPVEGAGERPAEESGLREARSPLTIVVDVAGNTSEPSDVVAATTLRTFTHIVRSGDTLWDICELYLGDPFRYPEIAELSRIADPHWIYPGDTVLLVIR